MADKRMFAQSIVLSDAFLDMPATARCLYFTLGMLADDDGFIGNPKSIMRQCGATEDDLKILIIKRYVLTFENGVIVIKHWRINNYLREDRKHSTTYQEELETLMIDEKGAYTEIDRQMPVSCQPNDRLDKNSINKNKLDKNSIDMPEEIKEDFNAYIEMRKKIKAPMTDYAIKLALKRLEELSKGDIEVKRLILQQSVVNCWKGLFELKQERNKDSLPNYDDSCNKYLSPEELEKSLARRKTEDSMPTYDDSKNKKLSNEELEELLNLRRV